MIKLTSPSKFYLRRWQQDFIDSYLKQLKPKSLLVSAPGSKAITALYAARQMLDRGIIDSILVLTPALDVNEYWRLVARVFLIELSPSIDKLSNAAHGFVVPVRALVSPHADLVEQIEETKRLFIVVDEWHGQKNTGSIVDHLLSRTNGSRALFLASAEGLPESFESEFRFESETILDSSIIERPEIENRIARFSPSFSLLRSLRRDKFNIDQLTWLELEKLIATLLEKHGYNVELMRGTKDGGVDVIGTKDLGAAGYFRTHWQAKTNLEKNKIGISVIRELADTRRELSASKAIIVTSSYLTKGALERVERDKYLIGKIDRQDLDSWIKRTLLDQA